MQYKSDGVAHESHLPANPPPRLTTRALPPYRFVPGINPHPVRDPAGHSHGRATEHARFIAPENWKKNDDYLYGVDLYNNAYWWEAHEAFETAWQTTDKTGPYGQYLQGLIQISAAFLKWRMGERAGVLKLSAIGMNRLAGVAAKHRRYMGLDVEKFLASVRVKFAMVQMTETLPDLGEAFPMLWIACLQPASHWLQ